MQAGWLRHVLIVEEKTSVRDAAGQEQDAWPEVQRLRGSIEPLRGREFHEVRQQHNDISVRIRIRHNRSISAETHRVRWTDEEGGEHIYEIISVIHQRQQRRQTELMCREVIQHG